MAFGTFIRQARNEKGFSLRQIASIIHVDPAHLSRVERGTRSPSDRMITQLASILGCSPGELSILAGRLPSTIRDSVDRKQLKPATAFRQLQAIYVSEPTEKYVPTDPNKGPKIPATRSAPPKSTLPLFQDSDTAAVITKVADLGTDQGERIVDPRNRLNDLTSIEWIPETVSVWNQRGLGAGHVDAQIERQHPAPFSFTDVARLIRFFSKPGDLVLDPFVGVGSTLKACALEGRRGIGIELSPRYAKLARERLQKEVRNSDSAVVKQKVIVGDARVKLNSIASESVDFVVTSPPYWTILHKEDHKARQERKVHDLDTRYSDDTRDLGNVHDYGAFLKELTGILAECGRTLKKKKYMAVIVSDFRNKSKFIMFHSDLATSLSSLGLGLRGLKVLYQRHKKIFPYGYPYAYVPNIHHQYILILQNER